MKKLLFTLLAILLTLSLSAALVSCGSEETSSAEGGSSEAETPSAEESSEVEQTDTSDPIAVENGLAVYMPESGELKIAQFADLHFGIEGNAYHNDKTARTKAYMQYVVETEKPDLIVCSGDNILSTGVEKLKEFVELMESFQTPWTFIYGNHDAEGIAAGYSKQSLSDYLESCETTYLLYDAGYVETDANRYGNFSISVLNNNGTKQLGALILLDAGTHNGSNYESLTEGQIAWYKSEIDKLSALYTGEGVMPSVVFSHIQIPEYYTAYKAALAGNGASFVIKQELPSSEIEGIFTGGPTDKNTGMFEAMKEVGSTVAFFCGHAHTFDFQVKMDGIVLGFGPQTGFSTLFEDNDLPRRTYVYVFDKDFNFTTEVCTEKGDGLGLTYWGTFDDSAVYNEADGTYTVSRNFSYGNSILFAFEGVRLTTDNTTFEGEFKVATSAQYKGGFYCPDGKTLIFDSVTAKTCTFVYDPAKNTLAVSTADIPVDPNAPKGVKVSTVNKDAGGDAVAVWTEAGTKIKYVTDASKGEGNWIGNGWRYYIVIDAEGRIAYAVLWPLSGYGGPMGSSYYTHPVYSSNYQNNPAIQLLDGFANDWASGGIGYTLFEIVIPEGGFAITSHGAPNYELVDMLSQGTVEDYGVANINTRSLYNSNIRVRFDPETNTVSITTVDE
ncbi:MAG: metallophosphoesterase [Clostridia bacterium]|nr:metallophosphoesterase [Clostridia bacterium]